MRRRPRDDQPALFDAPPAGAAPEASDADAAVPLADRIRPVSLADVVGQDRVLGPDSALARAIEADRLPSMILWGPPGCGKTTIARIVARRTAARFVPYSAVLGSVPELREILAEARRLRARERKRTILFVDEIHRFHKGQQDAFLPHVEDGSVTLVGATTENPSFAVTAPLLSRCAVFHLDPLGPDALAAVCRRALRDAERGLGAAGVEVEDDAVAAIAARADGDARRALATLEMAVEVARAAGETRVGRAALARMEADRTLLWDKKGEMHYDVASAFIKSMRGSDPDAAIYWLTRAIDAGEDPLFLLRRMIIFASEDVGNADPRAIAVATAADAAFRRLGMPEGMYPVAHACLYLACAPKSDGVKRAIGAARAAVDERGALPVPLALRNPVTPLLRAEGYGEGYKYAHDYEGHVVPGESYLPEALRGLLLYEPTAEGLEKAIGDRLARLRSR